MQFLTAHWHCILPVIGIVGYFIYEAFNKSKTKDESSKSHEEIE